MKSIGIHFAGTTLLRTVVPGIALSAANAATGGNGIAMTATAALTGFRYRVRTAKLEMIA